MVLSKTSFQHTCDFIVLSHGYFTCFCQISFWSQIINQVVLNISICIDDNDLVPNPSLSVGGCMGTASFDLACQAQGFLKQTNKKFFQNFGISSANKDSLFLHSLSVYFLFHFCVWLHCPELSRQSGDGEHPRLVFDRGRRAAGSSL